MSPFAKHNIRHLSASSLNRWRESPGLWALQYLVGIKDEGSPATWRGSAVEAGFEYILRKRGMEAALNAAYQTFDSNAQGEITDEIEAERARIKPMLEQCAAWVAGCNAELIFTQLRIEHWLPGIDIPVIGYPDFGFDDTGLLELKTTKACPSAARPEHIRQVAIYRAARQCPARILYVTDKKRAPFEVSDEERDAALAELASAARSLARFLSIVPDARTALECLPMQTDHYSFHDKAKLYLERSREVVF